MDTVYNKIRLPGNSTNPKILASGTNHQKLQTKRRKLVGRDKAGLKNKSEGEKSPEHVIRDMWKEKGKSWSLKRKKNKTRKK
jgi:hypothetical protein